jgi:predicted enzyme related to lactoylglutathione lyase
MPARIAHFEIQAQNDEQTAAFYRELLDWPTDPDGNQLSLTADKPGGGR